ncbi:MAG TPA: class I SAM-dependent RNA methyltransferase [Xanthobacteraceae bacterium]|nr:class I SAM-dependent RNA methyltransferase [Xanthobacteraceae bacterium]
MAEARLAIERVGHQGDGVAALGGEKVYIPNTLPGETILAALEKHRGVCAKILVPSPDRIAPICPYFGVCGGCALQHWKEESYRAWKRDLVVAALAHEGIEAPVGDLVDAHGKGRRRAVLHARRTREGVVAGFTARRSHAIVAIDHCPVLEPALARIFDIGRRLAAEAGAKPLDLQFTATEGGLDVDLRGSGPLGPAAQAALARIAAEERLARLTRHGEIIAQLAEPSIDIGRARVVLPPGGFLQATEAGENALASIVCAASEQASKVADLFCGIGTFSLRLAEKARVLAIDDDGTAIHALARAAKAPGLKPIEAAARDLFRRPLTAAELKHFDAVVLDPPRQGAEAQARALAQGAVPRIIYVSCNPASFARDARILSDGGYRLASLTPVDQFRYSPHAELVGVFDRRG